MKKIYCSIIGLYFCVTIVQAQNESGFGITSDSTESAYQNQDAMGGPKSIGAQLKADNQKKESFFRIPIRVMTGWYDWKGDLASNSGLQLGINYTSVFMKSSEVIDESSNSATASSGILDIQLGWTLVGRQSGKNKGTLFTKINSRHTYDDDKTPPMFHGMNESGYFGLPATGFNDYTIRVLEFNWQQSLMDDKLTIIAGKVDPTNYFNFHGLIVPWTSFMGYGSSVSGTVNWPDMGMGIIAGFKFSDNLYAMGGMTDVRGDIYEDGEFFYFGENFFKGNFFTALEVGYVPTMAERYFKKISLTYWNSSAYTASSGAEVASGSGLAFSSHWFFNNKYAPYFRFAFSDGNGENTFYKKDLQIGNAFLFKSHDLIGLSFSVAETVVPEAKNQMTAELYYRFQLTEHLAVTPDLQWIKNPTFNGNTKQLWYYGIRLRATL